MYMKVLALAAAGAALAGCTEQPAVIVDPVPITDQSYGGKYGEATTGSAVIYDETVAVQSFRATCHRRSPTLVRGTIYCLGRPKHPHTLVQSHLLE